MLETTTKTSLLGPLPGLPVVPDILRVPVALKATGKTPAAVATSLAKLVQSVESGVEGLATTKLCRYESWTEKLAGKNFRGLTQRHQAKANIEVQCHFEASTGFIERVQSLESIRAALGALDDGVSIGVGAPQWGIFEPERYRDAAAQQLQAQLRVSTGTFGIGIHEIHGSHALQVHIVGPTSAFIKLDVSVVLRA